MAPGPLLARSRHPSGLIKRTVVPSSGYSATTKSLTIDLSQRAVPATLLDFPPISQCRARPMPQMSQFEFGFGGEHGLGFERGDPLDLQRCQRHDHRDPPPGWLSASDNGQLRER